MCESEDRNFASFPSQSISDITQKVILIDYEPFTERNGNNMWDPAESFIDKGNGIYDIGEKFFDINGNNIRDLELWYVDKNKNGKWDDGDPFEDLNNDG